MLSTVFSTIVKVKTFAASTLALTSNSLLETKTPRLKSLEKAVTTSRVMDFVLVEWTVLQVAVTMKPSKCKCSVTQTQTRLAA